MQHSECSSAGDVGRLQDSLETRVSFGAAKSHNVCCSSRACSATAGAAGFGDVGNALLMSTLCSLCACVITAAPCCCCWLHCCCCFAFCSCRDLLQRTGVPTSAIDVAVVNSSASYASSSGCAAACTVFAAGICCSALGSPPVPLVLLWSTAAFSAPPMFVLHCFCVCWYFAAVGIC